MKLGITGIEQIEEGQTALLITRLFHSNREWETEEPTLILIQETFIPKEIHNKTNTLIAVHQTRKDCAKETKINVLLNKTDDVTIKIAVILLVTMIVAILTGAGKKG